MSEDKHASEQQIVLICCVRVDEGGPNFEAEAFRREKSKYIRVPCPECQTPMFLGTRSAVLVRKKAARMMCSKCTAEFTAKASMVVQTNLAQFVDPPDEEA